MLSRVISARTDPLSYTAREDVAPSGVLLPLAVSMPNSENHVSVEDEIATRVSHGYPSLKDDNAKVRYCLEEAMRGTQHVASIKSYQ